MNLLKNRSSKHHHLLGIGALLLALFGSLSSGPIARAADPAPPAGATCSQYVLTFPAWYRGLTDASCEIKIDEINDFIKIPLNILEILIQAVAYAATGFIVWGGFKYIKSEGEPNKISEAKSAILQAIIGLVIALGSVAIVRFVQGIIL